LSRFVFRIAIPSFARPWLTTSMLCMVALLTTIYPAGTSAQLANNPDDNVSSQQLYMCDILNRSVTPCLPATNNFSSVILKGQTEKLYAVTKSDKEIQFVEGINNQSKALRFSAYYGEFLNITDTSNLNPQQFSISFWAKKDPSFANYGHIVSHVNAGYTAGWLFDISNTTSQSIRFGVANTNGTLYSPDQEVSMPDDGRDDRNIMAPFTHVVGTFDGSTVKLYRNGMLLGSIPFNGTYNADPNVPIKVAMASFNFANPWGGMIDELRIYNRALTDQEVNSLFNNTATIANDGLVGYWPFDGSITDASGSNNRQQYLIQTSSMIFTTDGRLLFNEKNTGKIRVMQNDTVLAEPFATVPDLHINMEQGLLGITIDPDFTQNHYVYAYYTAANNVNNGTDTSSLNRVVRFTDEGNVGRNMTVIIDNIPANPYGMHAGGALAFGPDGKLYVTVGNAYMPNAAQDKDSLLGKVLRVNKDGSTPQDNPFPGSLIYTLGHRNMYGIAFDPQSESGIVTENGDDYYDEINPLAAGGNYGYPTVQMPNKPPQLAQNDSTIKPLRSYWKTIAPTQAIFYQGDKFQEIDGKFVVGSYNNGRLYAFKVNNTDQTPSLEEELKIEFPSSLMSNIIAVAESPSGDIYYGGYYIYKLKSLDNESRKGALAPITVDLSQPDVTGMASLPANVTDADTRYDIAGITFDPANTMVTIDIEKQLQQDKITITPETPSTEFGNTSGGNGDNELQGNSTLQSRTQNVTLTLRIDKQILRDIALVTVNEEKGEQDFGEHAVEFTTQVATADTDSDLPIVVSIPIVIEEDITSLEVSVVGKSSTGTTAGIRSP
jgi:glucose/arabinose dehydrogenase